LGPPWVRREAEVPAEVEGPSEGTESLTAVRLWVARTMASL
jgi:hypothetical protein